MPITSWQPTKRQEQCLQVPDEVFEVLYGGQAGGGKSELLLYLPIARQFYKEPRFKGLILRRTSPELEREIVRRSEVDGLYKACGGDYNGQHKRWKFPSGAVIQFGHCEHEKDVKIYDTSEYNYVAFDEVTSFTPYQYEYITYSRCRSSSNLPAIVRSGTNPGGVGHNYFRSRFIGKDQEDAKKREGKIIQEIRNVNGREIRVKILFIKSTVKDNPHILKNDPGYEDRIQLLPEADRIAKAEGDWWIYSGQVFEDFRSEKLPTEPIEAKHVVSPFEIPYFWPRILSIDWGYSAMIHALWSAINPLPSKEFPAKIYSYREYAAKKEKISTWASNLKILSHGEHLNDIVIDPSAFGHRGDEKTIDEQFAESFGLEARRADNDRIGGKLLIQEYLRWKRHPQRLVPVAGYDHDVAMRIRRIEGEEGLRRYESMFLKPEDEGFLPKWQVFNTCSVLINTIPLCIYDKTNPEDVQAFDGDDPYDNLRYNLKACQNYLDSGKLDASNEAERVMILNKLKETGNQTNFYMNMSALERREVKQTIPLNRRRYGSFRRRYAQR